MVMVRNIVVSFLAVEIFLMTLAGATTHNVGDTEGWSVGVDYEAWASKNSIKVGDRLVFTYLAGFHSVLHVTEEDYNSCTSTSPLATDDSGMTMTEPLTEGKYFFICGDPFDCELGMKLVITTSGYTGSEDSPPPPASKSRSPPSETSTPPPPQKVQPPPLAYSWLPKGSNSAQRYSTAGSFMVTFALMMLAIF